MNGFAQELMQLSAMMMMMKNVRTGMDNVSAAIAGILAYRPPHCFYLISGNDNIERPGGHGTFSPRHVC